MPFLARKAFIAGAGALAAAAVGFPALASEQLVNNVRIEDDRWLLPGWETLTDPDAAGTAKTLDLVSETAKMLAAKGIGLLLASIPFKARYCPDLPSGSLAPVIASRYAGSLAAMQSRGLKTVDLEAALRPVQSAYYPTDQHWTWDAVDAAGDALAAALRANWSVPDRGKHEPLQPLVTDKRYGDLATLLPPDLRTQIGVETYRLRTAYGGDLNGYSEYTGSTDPQPKDAQSVQLVGSSFVRPMWGLPQKLANLLGTDVGLTFFNGDAGPYHALLMNLRSTLPKRAPAVVIWQMTEANLHLGPAATGWWNITSLMSPDFFLSHVQEAVGG
jgi:alginate O-acetyltransferase complex protein AlgJ